MNNASDFNYTCQEHCDECGKVREGVMHHCNDAAGIATPVLWTCNYCENPPLIVAWFRRVKRTISFKVRRVRYFLSTTKKERMARVRRQQDAIARINENRLERGAKPVEWRGIPGVDY